MRLHSEHTVMKTLFLLFLVLPSMVSAQHITASSAEPVVLYEKISSLAGDHPHQAILGFRQVVAFYESQGREDELPENYFGMALMLALNGHYKESIRYHKKAIRVHRRYREDEPYEIVMNLGLTYALAGRERKARRILGDGYFRSAVTSPSN